jgi:hypothetical protein
VVSADSEADLRVGEAPAAAGEENT